MTGIAKQIARAAGASPSTSPPTAPSTHDGGRDADARAYDDGGPEKASIATQIVGLVNDAGVTLWHEADSGDAYAQIPERGHTETHALRSRGAKDWIARLAYTQLGKVPGAQALNDAITVLAGMAAHEGEGHPVAVRVAGRDDHVYVDLCDDAWRVLDIGPQGWQVVHSAPVRFRRSRSARPLPMPVRGGSLDSLRRLLNVEDDRAWMLLVGWLVGALSPNGPYSILALVGEQGTAKSTTARMLRACVDPFKALLQGAIRNFDDLPISLRHQHVLAIDNISSLSKEASDTLARIATGDGTTKRALYSDDDLHVTATCKPIVLTSIPLTVERPDLADRAIVVRCPVISEEQRRTERELWAAFASIHPGVLGALADAVACALRRRGDVRLPRAPRMVDHVTWIEAAAPALGWPDGAYVAAYAAQQGESTAQQVEDDAIAPRVLALVATQSACWEGSTADLLKALTPEPTPRDWPRSARALSAELTRLAPALRRMGVELTPPDRRRKARTWRVARKTGTTGTIGTGWGNRKENLDSPGAGLGADVEVAPADRHQTGTAADRQAPDRHHANTHTGTDLADSRAGGAEGAGLSAGPRVTASGGDDDVLVA